MTKDIIICKQYAYAKFILRGISCKKKELAFRTEEKEKIIIVFE